MSYRITIGCPDCRIVMKYISLGTIWTPEDLEGAEKVKKKIYSTKFICPQCKKEFNGKEGHLA